MQATTIDMRDVDTAHRAVRADPSIQFDFPWRTAPVRETPGWLRALGEALGRFLHALNPFWQVVFWVMVALIVAVLVATLFPPVRQWLRARFGRAQGGGPAPHWQPTRPRQLLEEAEAMANQGRFAAAIRLLLHRSVEDLDRWRHGLVRPASTARELAAAPDLPPDARHLFATLVRLSEQGTFAARPLAEADWHRARATYRDFAL